MEVRGICSLCGRPGKMYTCELCGGLVCAKCYVHSKGVCRVCDVRSGRRISPDKTFK